MAVVVFLFYLTGSAYALVGQDNQTNYSSSLISIPKVSVSQSQPIIGNFTPNENTTVPEFGNMSYLVLVLSIISVLAIYNMHVRVRM